MSDCPGYDPDPATGECLACDPCAAYARGVADGRAPAERESQRETLRRITAWLYYEAGFWALEGRCCAAPLRRPARDVIALQFREANAAYANNAFRRARDLARLAMQIAQVTP